MRNTIFYKQNSCDASIEDLIKQLGDIQYDKPDKLKSGQKNTKLGDTLTIEADNEKVFDLLSQYLTSEQREIKLQYHPDRPISSQCGGSQRLHHRTTDTQ